MPSQPDAEFIAIQAAFAGEYSLDRELGRGGMGIVYLAREVRLARPVAIKVLPPALAANAELRTGFLREAETVAQLNHPNIVPVYAAGERNGFVFIAMAYVDGTTLGERIRTRGPLLPGQAARVLREVAWALAYAHGARIVHRDVSAENILLERGSERAVVTDFGLASETLTAALDAEGRIMGNAHYVSPEHAAGEPVDARSDLYSLGVAGYYALTGRLPFDGETSADVVAQHLTATAPPITSVASSVPPRLAAAVERCLHKEPFRRYRNAESFAEAIDLAFEHAKEIPAPLRSWINQSERELPARLAVLGFGASTGVTLALALHEPWWFMVPFVLFTSLTFIPPWQRLRRVLSDGYRVDDLYAALREHQLVRAEEIEYERLQTSPAARRALRVVLGASLSAGGIGGYLMYRAMHAVAGVGAATIAANDHSEMQVLLIILAALVGVTISAVPLIGEWVRFKLASRITASGISFWKSKWGARIAEVAGIGLKPVERPILGMPLLTEIALGRATDHLFHALPKAARRELAALPDTVRRLEADASRLRESVSAIDDQLAVFDRSSTRPADAASSSAEGVIARGDVERELRESRSQAAGRLAATVAALENIRLDLLRLQMGTAGLASVTASLEAAQRVGERIDVVVEANADVETFLRNARHEIGTVGIDEDVDADTPVGGVPAARA